MKKLALGCGILAVLGGIVLIIVLIAGGSYNRLVGLSQGVNSSWAQVQNVYQRRADLIPNLVATVSGSANFEKSTLTEITAARAGEIFQRLRRRGRARRRRVTESAPRTI